MQSRKKQKKKKNLFSRLVDTMAGIVMPMIGPLAGAGMIKAILSLLTQFALVSKESQTYQLFYLVADGVFYYMPFFLAFSAGKKFKCNPYLSLIFAAMLVHPNYIALKTAGEAVKAVRLPAGNNGQLYVQRGTYYPDRLLPVHCRKNSSARSRLRPLRCSLCR